MSAWCSCQITGSRERRASWRGWGKASAAAKQAGFRDLGDGAYCTTGMKVRASASSDV